MNVYIHTDVATLPRPPQALRKEGDAVAVAKKPRVPANSTISGGYYGSGPFVPHDEHEVDDVTASPSDLPR